METPVVEFVENYRKEHYVRLHVPGHKGSGNPLDITEIKGADVLYHDDGILMDSQRNASLIFGTAETVYSAEGSSLGIRAMLALMKMYRLTKNEKLFNLAKHFIDIRGVDPRYYEKERSTRQWTVWNGDGRNHYYQQSQSPVRQQKDAMR